MRGMNSPWRNWKSGGLSHIAEKTLTFTEVNAVKIAYASGKFSKASIARMYDVDRYIIDAILKGTYRYHRES